MSEVEASVVFFDTSALVKRYHREVGTDVVVATFSDHCADRPFVGLIEAEGFSVINPEASLETGQDRSTQ